MPDSRIQNRGTAEIGGEQILVKILVPKLNIFFALADAAVNEGSILIQDLRCLMRLCKHIRPFKTNKLKCEIIGGYFVKEKPIKGYKSGIKISLYCTEPLVTA